jgi:hypothetical protein
MSWAGEISNNFDEFIFTTVYKFLYVHDVQTGQKYLKTYNFTYIFKIKVQFSK